MGAMLREAQELALISEKFAVSLDGGLPVNGTVGPMVAAVLRRQSTMLMRLAALCETLYAKLPLPPEET